MTLELIFGLRKSFHFIKVHSIVRECSNHQFVVLGDRHSLARGRSEVDVGFFVAVFIVPETNLVVFSRGDDLVTSGRVCQTDTGIFMGWVIFGYPVRNLIVGHAIVIALGQK